MQHDLFLTVHRQAERERELTRTHRRAARERPEQVGTGRSGSERVARAVTTGRPARDSLRATVGGVVARLRGLVPVRQPLGADPACCPA